MLCGNRLLIFNLHRRRAGFEHGKADAGLQRDGMEPLGFSILETGLVFRNQRKSAVVVETKIVEIAGLGLP